mmetsp:Transcript_92227/g.192859  ORF Transcript_92227/g.192859 Transcript_92227/m.192859 type:complete len:554 (+) Transcript_92227:135-1796(+)|eukprot:CAMPEP_0206469124 /NCGR_PEP_ID=MMETSP0324_2-20121206/30068_1 /ASSEMBLY_ACC=CAM_ASM_000836 /TAXON_ID=2866 /ORGANISM="Crypthecodinium cohnii, Strain Seligo" /LENGTH=553 /DNA_ID=CAMNT_0053942773 /DNA_START=81 /DNA_END=1742 /DNA_ORIENTATION=+
MAASITGRFDPSALERGVEALKELSTASNANKAFELLKAQEVTKQKELQAECEQLKTHRTQIQSHKAEQDAEERRRTQEHQGEQERRTAEYKNRLDNELYQSKMEEQQKQIDQQLQMQEHQFQRQEELRKQSNLGLEEEKRQTMREAARLDREVAAARAKAEATGRIQHERENLEVRIREMRARMAEERKTKMESLQAIFSGLGSGSKALLEDRTKMASLVGGLTALAVGVYGARAVTRVAGNMVERSLMRPPLVRETSRFHLRGGTGGSFSRFLPSFKRKQEHKLLENIILDEELASRLEWTSNSLINAKKNGTPFRHMLLHGPPGTGKTLFARTLSKQSGLDYAIMSGGDVGPLGREAVNELNKLFSWANSSRKGLILFIDEADAFLRAGRGAENGSMSEEARNVLSAFLHHTGTESDKFAVIMATNIRSSLDRAVLDRVDESFEFPLPGLEERKRMLQLFMEEHIRKPTTKGKTIEIDEELSKPEWLEDVAKRTEGFSGRQLAKLVIAYQAAVFGSGTTRLTANLAEVVLQYKLIHREEDAHKAAKASEY